MAEEPEQVLIQVAAAPELAGEERGLHGAVGEQHVHPADQHRGGQHHQEGDRDHGPDEDRQAAPPHARGPVVDHGHDDVEPGQDDRDPHQAERHRVGVRTLGSLHAERRVAGPPERESADQDAGEQDDEGGRGQPEGERLQPGEGHPLGADHQRHQVVAERAEHDRRHQHHHHRAVLAHHLDVGAGIEHVVGRRQQFRPDRHREQAGRAEVDDHSDQVLDADDLVVQGVPEEPGDAGRRLVFLFEDRHRLAEHLPEQVVEHAQAAEPADRPEHVPEDEREVVRIGQRVAGVAAGQEVAQPVTNHVAEHGADQSSVDRGPHPPRPGRTRGRRSLSRRVLCLLRLYFDGHPVTSSSERLRMRVMGSEGLVTAAPGRRGGSSTRWRR